MKCDKCVRKDYCAYIHQFNQDPNIGCIEFQEEEHTLYISTNTLNIKENGDNKTSLTQEKYNSLKEDLL